MIKKEVILQKEIAALAHSKDTIAQKDASLFDAQKLILSNKSAVVLMDEGRVVGIITRRDLLFLLNDRVLFDEPAMKYAKRDIIYASGRRSIDYAMHLMINHDIRRLVVVDDDGLYIGLVTQDDLMFEFNEQSYYEEPRAIHLLGSQCDIVCMHLDTIAKAALIEMVDKKVSSAVVVDDDNKPIGIVTESTLLALSLSKIETMRLSEIMSAPLDSVSTGTPLGRIVEEMQSMGFRHLAVLDSDGFAVGVIDSMAVLRNIEGSFGRFLQKKLKSTRDALNALPQIVMETVVVDGEYRIQWANERAKSMFGMGLVDRRLGEIVGEEYWGGVFLGSCDAVVQPLMTLTGERYFEICSLMSDSDRFQLSLNDITHIVELQKELEQKTKAAALNLQRLEFAKKAVGLGIWDLHIDTNELIWDDSLYDMYGIPRESGKNNYEIWREAVLKEDLAEAEEKLLKSISDGSKLQMEFRINKNGEIRYIESKAEVIQEDGVVKRLIGENLDVTDKKTTEKELIYIKESLDRGQGVAHLGSWDLNLETNYLWWSDEIYRIFSLKPQEFAATYDAFLERIHPDDRDAVSAAVNNSIANKTQYEIVHRIVLKNGEEKIVKEKGNTFFDDNGNAVRMIGIVHDITEQVVVERRLESSERKFKTIFEQSHDGLVIINPVTQLFFDFNAKAHSQLGYTAQEFAALSIKDIDIIETPEITKTHIEKIQRLGFDNFETKHRAKNGEIRDMLVTVKLIYIGDGPVMFCTFRDISESKKIEEDLKNAKNIAEYANRAKSEFLANMSHEIRTPMNAVLGFAELLKNEELDQKSKSYVNGIIVSGRNLLGLINDILDLSKIEAGKMSISLEPTDLKRIFKELQIIFEMKAKEKGLIYEVEVSDDFPKALLLDETRVKQILFNLLGNAVKFTEKGIVKLSASAKKSQDIPGCIDVVIEVKDSGIGIPKEQLEDVFDAFRQADGQSTRKYGGTGLGLTISRKLANTMGAYIDVKSEVGKGSLFVLHLSGLEVAAVKEYEEEDEDDNIELESGVVLLVEDIATNREVVKGFLSSHGVTVFEAENGEIGVQIAKEKIPSLILMDIQMPVMNGYEAIRILKKDELTKDIPIIALTASVLGGQKDEIESICDGYLQKPVDSKTLIGELSKFLPHKTVKNRFKESSQTIELAGHEREQVASCLEAEWLNVARLKSNDEIEEFARLARATADTIGSKALEVYANSLIEACESFRIKEINKIFLEFEKLIKGQSR